MSRDNYNPPPLRAVASRFELTNCGAPANSKLGRVTGIWPAGADAREFVPYELDHRRALLPRAAPVPLSGARHRT
jgi:hypothetical protein